MVKVVVNPFIFTVFRIIVSLSCLLVRSIPFSGNQNKPTPEQYNCAIRISSSPVVVEWRHEVFGLSSPSHRHQTSHQPYKAWCFVYRYLLPSIYQNTIFMIPPLVELLPWSIGDSAMTGCRTCMWSNDFWQLKKCLHGRVVSDWPHWSDNRRV